MSLELSPVIEGEPPYEMRLVLRCDGHPAIDQGDTLTISGPSLMAMFDEAKRKGWSKVTGGDTRGPCCA